MKRTLEQGFLLFLIALLCMLQVGAATGGMSWYCMRNKAHKQPVCESNFKFVEEYDAYFIDHAHGDDAGEKVVYLTFDAGYENGNVAKVLDTLKETGTPAAFFVLKHLITANGDLVRRMANEGHLVCNHTAHHPDLACASPEKIRAELEEVNAAYRELTGSEMPRFFRPPEGSFSREMLKTVQGLGYKTVFWSFAYADWDNQKQPSPERALQCVRDNIHNGAVMLLHPTSATNAEILPAVISDLKAEGYRFGTLNELCGGC